MRNSLAVQISLVTTLAALSAIIGAYLYPGWIAVTIGLLVGLVTGLLISTQIRRSLRGLMALTHGSSSIVPYEVLGEIREFSDRLRELIRSAEADREQLIRYQEYEPATGFLNHRAFQVWFSQEIRKAQEVGNTVSLLLIDLDRFRRVNDSFGHLAGEEALEKVAETLRATVAKTGIIGRCGGEEFGVILPDSDLTEACRMAELIRQNISSYPYVLRTPSAPGGRVEVPVTVSIGVASCPVHGGDRAAVYSAAEAALLHAKHLGRNRVASYSSLAQTRGDMDAGGLSRLLSDPSLAAIETLAQAVDARDAYTRGHSDRVALYSASIATEMGFTTMERELLRTAALLHDVGKIGIPDAILNKPGKLTDEEFAVIKTHPKLGAEILEKAPQLDPIVRIVLCHHERMDGRGYPNGVAGKDIPLMARILAAADTLDAITSDRPYRPGKPLAEAMEEIVRCSGSQFDPDVVTACQAAFLKQRRRAA